MAVAQCGSRSVVSNSLQSRGLYVACQAPLSMGFSRQEYWSELLFPSPGDLSNPGVEPRSLTLQADSLPSEPPGKPPGNYECRHAKLLQLCLTLCDPMDCSPPGSSVHGILQARILEVCHFLLQGISMTQGSNPNLLCLLHWQADSLPLCLLRSPSTNGSYCY